MPLGLNEQKAEHTMARKKSDSFVEDDNEFHIEEVVEKVLFGGRWLLAPLYVGLLLSLVPLIYRFFIEFLHLMEGVATLKMQEITLKILELLDVWPAIKSSGFL